MADFKDVIDTLDKAADGFGNIANAEQKKIYEEVVTLAKDLETDAQGKVKQTITNLKRLNQIKAKLAALSKDKEWVAGIGKFVKYFDILQKQQNAYFSTAFPQLTLGESAKKRNEMMKQIAVNNTIEALMGDGLKANVTDKLNDILLRGVTSGAKWADLQQELRDHLMGKEGGQGAFARYATTYATTALSQYTGQHNQLLTKDLGLEWFMYVGSNIETTREFCEVLTKKKWIHKSEIPTILTGKIDDYQCEIYPKTGLPKGMIADTTPENFQCNCGGWNCRHQLIPVAEAAVPADVREKFKQIRPTLEGSDTSMKKGKDAFYELMKLQNQMKQDVDLQIDEFKKYNVKFDYNEEMTASQIQREYYKAIDKMQKAYDKLDSKKEELKLIRALIDKHMRGKHQIIMDESAFVKSPTWSLINRQGYEKTKADIENLHKRMVRIANGLMDTDKDIKYDKSNVKKIAKSLNISVGNPMTFMQANSGKVNPNYDDGTFEHTHNCQRCVVAFEMRIRGLNVYAGDRVPYKKNSIDNDPFFIIANNDSSSIWINKKTGKPTERYNIWEPSLEKSINKFNALSKETGRYVLYIQWKKEGAHVVNFIRNKRGQIIFYDPQPKKNVFENFEYYYSNSKDHAGALALWRVDDCNLDERIISAGALKVY